VDIPPPAQCLYGKIVITLLSDDFISSPGQLSPPNVADVVLGFFVHIFENSLIIHDRIIPYPARIVGDRLLYH